MSRHRKPGAPRCGCQEPRHGQRFRLSCGEPFNHEGDHVARGMAGQECGRWPRQARAEFARVVGGLGARG